MGFIKRLEQKNYDIIIYTILIFCYGLGWDFVTDEQLDLWSVIGVISYTIFVLLLFIKWRKSPEPPEASGQISPLSRRADLIGKIIIAIILYGLLVYKLITGLKLN